MITQTSFLGLPLRTERQRRLLVVLYYLFLITLGVIGLIRGTTHVGYLIPQILTFGGLLGGIKIGGPVKPYADPKLPLALGSDVQTLNLSGRKTFDPFSPYGYAPLDEREQLQRDFAHYTAYRILRWTLGFACCLYWLVYANAPLWLSTKGPILAWLLLIYVLSLPQSVLLWTEPNAPTADIIEIPSAS